MCRQVHVYGLHGTSTQNLPTILAVSNWHVYVSLWRYYLSSISSSTVSLSDRYVIIVLLTLCGADCPLGIVSLSCLSVRCVHLQRRLLYNMALMAFHTHMSQNYKGQKSLVMSLMLKTKWPFYNGINCPSVLLCKILLKKLTSCHFWKMWAQIKYV